MAAFVNRLPTELLVEIFLNLVNLPWPRRRHTANLVTATHVCSHWRRVAVGAARLWTAVPLHNRVAADTFFKRSKGLGVKLSLRGPHGYVSRGAVQAIQDELHRVRAVRLTVHYSSGMDIAAFINIFRGSAPMLEEFHFEVLGSIEDSRANQLSRMPPLVFEKTAPLLRCLDMGHFDIGLRFALANSIVHLSIRKNRQLPAAQLLNLLSYCPLLETLNYACPGQRIQLDDSFAQIRSDLLIELPRLKRAQIVTQPGSGMTEILSHITIPPSAALRLATAQYTDFPPSYWFIPEQSTSNLKCLVGIKRMELLFEALPDTHARFFLRAFHDSDATFGEPALEIKITASKELDSAMALSGYLSSIPFDVSGVETLVVSGFREPFSISSVGASWNGVLDGMQALRRLRVVSSSALTVLPLVRLLGRQAPVDEPELDPGFRACPKLEALEFLDVPRDPFEGYAPLYETIIRRVVYGVLKEVDLFQVGGWTKEVAAQLMQELEGMAVVQVEVDQMD